MNKRRPALPVRGFTLVELAITVSILGMLAIGLLGTVRTLHEQESRRRNQEQLDEIREALLGFAVEHGRLPCPDCRDAEGKCAGVAVVDRGDAGEDIIGPKNRRECATPVGDLPAVDLGLPAVDPWGRRLHYALSANYATEDTDPALKGACFVPPDAWFGICTPARLTVTNKPLAPKVTAHPCSPSGPPGPADVVTIEGIAALVISEGEKANKHAPLSCYELQNVDNGPDPIFVASDYRTHTNPALPNDETANYYFDDMVMWLSPHVLRSRMIAAGKLP